MFLRFTVSTKQEQVQHSASASTSSTSTSNNMKSDDSNNNTGKPKERRFVGAYDSVCAEYVRKTNVVLSAGDYTPLHVDPYINTLKNQSRPVIPTFIRYQNSRELHLVRHEASGSVIAYCYVERLYRVKRAFGKIKTMFPGFRSVKFSSQRDKQDPVLAPFARYFAAFVESIGVQKEGRNVKCITDMMAAKFVVFYKQEEEEEANEDKDTEMLATETSSSATSTLTTTTTTTTEITVEASSPADVDVLHIINSAAAGLSPEETAKMDPAVWVLLSLGASKTQ